MPQEDEETYPPIVISSDEGMDRRTRKEEHTKEEGAPSVSPGRREREITLLCTPQSPPYPST